MKLSNILRVLEGLMKVQGYVYAQEGPKRPYFHLWLVCRLCASREQWLS